MPAFRQGFSVRSSATVIGESHRHWNKMSTSVATAKSSIQLNSASKHGSPSEASHSWGGGTGPQKLQHAHISLLQEIETISFVPAFRQGFSVRSSATVIGESHRHWNKMSTSVATAKSSIQLNSASKHGSPSEASHSTSPVLHRKAKALIYWGFWEAIYWGKLWETYQLKIVPSRTFEGELPVKTSMQRPDHGMLFSLRCRQLLAATTSRRHVAVACHGTPYVLHNILTYSDICKEDLAPIINIPEKIDI